VKQVHAPSPWAWWMLVGMPSCHPASAFGVVRPLLSGVVGPLLSGVLTIVPLLLIALLTKRSDNLIVSLALVGLVGFVVFTLVITGVRRAKVKAQVGRIGFEAGWSDDPRSRGR
jgi:hypothetical protein